MKNAEYFETNEISMNFDYNWRKKSEFFLGFSFVSKRFSTIWLHATTKGYINIVKPAYPYARSILNIHLYIQLYSRSHNSKFFKLRLHWNLKERDMWLENSDCLLVNWLSWPIGYQNFPVTISHAFSSPNVNEHTPYTPTFVDIKHTWRQNWTHTKKAF